MSIFSVVEASWFAVELRCGSFPAGLYDWTENLPLWNIARIFLDATWTARKRGFFDAERLIKEQHKLIFVVRFNIKLNPGFHKIIKQKLKSKTNLKMLVEFENLGKSTITVSNRLKDSASDEILGMTSEKHVLVDRTTRRPSMIPQWFQEVYGPMRKPSQHTFLQRNLSSTVPQNAFRVNLITRYSDIDVNGHVTTAVYIEYFMECASAASRAGYFQYLTHPLSNYNLEELDVSYVAECRVQEEITSFVWQNEEKYQLISFAVYLRETCLVYGEALFGDNMNIESKL